LRGLRPATEAGGRICREACRSLEPSASLAREGIHKRAEAKQASEQNWGYARGRLACSFFQKGYNIPVSLFASLTNTEGKGTKKLRKVIYDDYINRLKKKSLQLYTSWAARMGKTPRSSKPRDVEEDIILFLLDQQRWQKVLASGRIEKVGSRRYRFK
jgi:hypothetical protein